MDRLVEFFLLAGAVLGLMVPVVIGVVAWFNKAFTIKTRYKPVIALIAAELLTVPILSYLQYPWQLAAFAGLLVGLAASGVYAYGKAREGESPPA